MHNKRFDQSKDAAKIKRIRDYANSFSKNLPKDFKDHVNLYPFLVTIEQIKEMRDSVLLHLDFSIIFEVEQHQINLIIRCDNNSFIKSECKHPAFFKARMTIEKNERIIFSKLDRFFLEKFYRSIKTEEDGYGGPLMPCIAYINSLINYASSNVSINAFNGNVRKFILRTQLATHEIEANCAFYTWVQTFNNTEKK
jgi:hypothetical protein